MTVVASRKPRSSWLSIFSTRKVMPFTATAASSKQASTVSNASNSGSLSSCKITVICQRKALDQHEQCRQVAHNAC